MKKDYVKVCHLTYDWNGHFDMQVGYDNRTHEEIAMMAAKQSPYDWHHESTCTAVRDRIMALSKELLRLKGGLGDPNPDGSPRYDATSREGARYKLPAHAKVATKLPMVMGDLDDYKLAGRFRMLMRDTPNHSGYCMAAFQRIMYLLQEVATLTTTQEASNASA